MTQKTKLIDRILGKKAEAAQGAALASPVPIVSKVSKDFTRFDRFPGYEKMLVPKAAAERFGLAVASRTIIWSLIEQLRVSLMPLFHGLHRCFAVQC